jgi:hypothetical protein
MDKGSKQGLAIHRMPEGGYLVMEAFMFSDQGMFRMPLFASTRIEDALDFIKGMISPVEPSKGSS